MGPESKKYLEKAGVKYTEAGESVFKLATGALALSITFKASLVGDDVTGTDHERIMSAHEVMLPWAQLETILDRLDGACHSFDHELIREILLTTPTGFNPTDGICDLVWLVRNMKYGDDNTIVPLVS